MAQRSGPRETGLAQIWAFYHNRRERDEGARMNVRGSTYILSICGALGSAASARVTTVPTPEEMPVIEVVAAQTAPSAVQGAGFNPPGVKPQKTNQKVSGRQYFTPTPAKDAPLNVSTFKTFGDVPSEKLGTLLSEVDESVQIEQLDASGNVTSPVAGGSVKKGYYRVSYYYYRYRNIPCTAGTPGSGGIAVGAGLRVTATISSLKSNVSVSGFMPLAAAAELNKISGKLRVQSSGIASGTGSISSYLSGASDLNPEAIRKAVESFGVVKAVFETTNLSLTPNYLFVESDDIGKCLADFKPATT
jgi:hypothetical protein